MHGYKQFITETNSGATVGINVSEQQLYGHNLGSRLAEWTDPVDTSDVPLSMSDCFGFLSKKDF
jgi:hypothetical protein